MFKQSKNKTNYFHLRQNKITMSISIIDPQTMELPVEDFKGGRGFQDAYSLLKELEPTKLDVSLSASKMQYKGGNLYFNLPRKGGQKKEIELRPSSHFDGQIATSLGIPVRYYRKMRDESPELLDNNVNFWLEHQAENRTNNGVHMVRAYMEDSSSAQGIARAFLGGSYLRIDHLDAIATVLEALKNNQQVKDGKFIVDSCSLNLDNFYLRLKSQDIYTDSVKLLKSYRRPDGKGADTSNYIYSGLIIKNSETGMGQFEVAPTGVVAKCNNMQIFSDSVLQRRHVGVKLEDGINWSGATRLQAHELVKSMMTDAIETYLSQDFLETKVRSLEEAKLGIEHRTETIQQLAKSRGFSEGVTDNLVESFLGGGDYSTFGVKQALTFTAQSQKADARYDLEKVAGLLNDQGIKSFDYKN